MPNIRSAIAIKSKLTNILACLKLDLNTSKLHQRCPVMTTHGYGELHSTRPCPTRVRKNGICRAQWRRVLSELAGDTWLRQPYGSCTRMNSETMNVQALMWSLLCRTKALIWICWTMKHTVPNPLLDPPRRQPTCMAPTVDDWFRLALDYEVASKMSTGVCREMECPENY